MGDMRRKLMEDKALRDMARSIVGAQFSRVREALSGQRIGAQLADRVGDDTIDLAADAANTLKRNGGMIAGIVAAVGAGAAALWFAREPLMELLRPAADDAFEADEVGDEEIGG